MLAADVRSPEGEEPSPAVGGVAAGRRRPGRRLPGPLAVEPVAAIDRWLRAREGHRSAGESALCMGGRFTYDALG